jgi:hypothetical protein
MVDSFVLTRCHGIVLSVSPICSTHNALMMKEIKLDGNCGTLCKEAGLSLDQALYNTLNTCIGFMPESSNGCQVSYEYCLPCQLSVWAKMRKQ